MTTVIIIGFLHVVTGGTEICSRILHVHTIREIVQNLCIYPRYRSQYPTGHVKEGYDTTPSPGSVDFSMKMFVRTSCSTLVGV